MNKAVDRFLKIGDRFMLETHLRQTGFTCSACGPFTKTNKEFKDLWRLEIQNTFTEMN